MCLVSQQLLQPGRSNPATWWIDDTIASCLVLCLQMFQWWGSLNASSRICTSAAHKSKQTLVVKLVTSSQFDMTGTWALALLVCESWQEEVRPHARKPTVCLHAVHKESEENCWGLIGHQRERGFKYSPGSDMFPLHALYKLIQIALLSIFTSLQWFVLFINCLATRKETKM